MKTTTETSSQLELFSSPQKKTLMEIIAQLERIQYRYRRYATIYAHQIGEILGTFKKYDYNWNNEEDTYDEFDEKSKSENRWNIGYTKIHAVSQQTLYKNLHALKEFNEKNKNQWGIVDYLYISINRSKKKEKVSLVHPHSFPKIQENIDMLKEIGFAGEELNRYLMYTMDLIKNGYINYTPQRNRDHIDRLKNELGFSHDEIRIFMYQVPDFFYCPLVKYQSKVVHLQQLGCQKEDIKKIIKEFPHCLDYSEEKISRTFQKIKKINTDSWNILLQYPHLLYFNAETDFFRRVVIGLMKGHKTYLRIIGRTHQRFAYKGGVDTHMYQNDFPIASEEEYLHGLQTQEHKKYFLFNPEESKKAFGRWRDKIFNECLKYVFPAEQKVIIMIYQKDYEGKELSQNEKITWEYLKNKIQKQSQQCYDDLFKVFNHTKDIVSRLSEDDDLPF